MAAGLCLLICGRLLLLRAPLPMLKELRRVAAAERAVEEDEAVAGTVDIWRPNRKRRRRLQHPMRRPDGALAAAAAAARRLTSASCNWASLI
jgi:hypothetical protein